jgi:hypothetical protein
MFEQPARQIYATVPRLQLKCRAWHQDPLNVL